MKIIRTCASVSTVVLLFIYAGLTLPVTAQRNAGTRMEVMARILTDAGCPLTPVQLEQFKGIESGPGAREKVQTILTDEQKTALKNATVGQRREGLPGPVSPLLFMARILTDAGCPLTDAQKEQLKGIERGPGAREKVQTILTDEQKTALKNAAVGQRREGLPGPVSPLLFMARTLDKAGCPLTDDQKEQLKGIERGPGAREKVQAILTDEQKTALKNAAVGQRREGLPGPVSPLLFMARTLDKAGCPLTDAQKEQLKGIESGPGAREKVQTILTDEQKEALKNAFKERADAAPRRGFMMAKILKEAGYPLSSEQKEQLKAMEPGLSVREQVKAILTPDQLKALEAHFNIEPTDKESLDESNKPAETEQQPESFNMLYQNYPNPFNPSTTIEYRLAENGPVTVEIFGLNGQLIETLVNSYQQAGQHTVTWDASSLAGGVYVCRITAGKYIESRKMTYVK